MQGTVDAEGVGCGQLRVDVVLTLVDGKTKTTVGSLTTDASGAFDASVYLPLGLPVGAYDVTLATPGDARCGEGVSTP